MAEDEDGVSMTFAPQTTEDLKKFLEDAERLKQSLNQRNPKTDLMLIDLQSPISRVQTTSFHYCLGASLIILR